MNKNLIQRRFTRAVKTYSKEASVQQRIAEKLVEYVAENTEVEPNRLIDIGCGTGHLTRAMLKRYTPQRVYMVDLCREMQGELWDLLTSGEVSFEAYDADNSESLLPENLDLVASSSALQWFSNPSGFFERAAKSLNKNGILAISTFAPDNLMELQSLGVKSLSYPSVDELIAMMKVNQFEVLASNTQTTTIHFDTPSDVLKHLKRTGVNGIEGKAWTKSMLVEFEEKYTEKYSTSCGVPLTYKPLYIIAKKRDEK